MSSQRRDQAVRNCDDSGQFHDEYAKATPELICDLLDDCRGEIKPTATQLLEEMAARRWSIAATLHEGGRGGAGRDPDRSAHFTVRVGGITYHLKCRATNHGHYIWNITS